MSGLYSVNASTCIFLSTPSLKDESIFLAEQLKTEIRKTEDMKVTKIDHSFDKTCINKSA